ncbi:MAG TPA: hypothetical protein DCQ64_18105 [Candidatus Rokubacteria bacterium]|nr:hypothetical protein [Candidatus Rokubacteria bacterium]
MAHTITRSPRGADSQFGFAVETAYNDGTAVASFLSATSGGIGIKPRVGVIESAGRVPGRISDPAGNSIVYDNGGEGSLTFELQRKNLLKLWRWAIGHNATPAQQAATIAYLTTFNKDATAALMSNTGKSLSIQTGVPMRGGTVEPFNFKGVKCTGWEVSCDAGGIALATFNVDACSALHTVDLAAPSYPAEYVPLGWYSAGAVKRAGTVLPGVRSVKFATENGLTGEDYGLFDGTGLRAEPQLNGNVGATLELEIEPSDLALTYDDWLSNTPRAWVFELVGATIASTYKYTWRVTIAEGYIQGEPPAADSGDEMVTHSLTIKANDNGTDPLYKVEVMETATTI